MSRPHGRREEALCGRARRVLGVRICFVKCLIVLSQPRHVILSFNNKSKVDFLDIEWAKLFFGRLTYNLQVTSPNVGRD